MENKVNYTENNKKYSQELINEAISIFRYRVTLFRKILIFVLVIVYLVYFFDYVLKGGKAIFETLAILSLILFASIIIVIYSESKATKKRINKICDQLLEEKDEHKNNDLKK